MVFPPRPLKVIRFQRAPLRSSVDRRSVYNYGINSFPFLRLFRARHSSSSVRSAESQNETLFCFFFLPLSFSLSLSSDRRTFLLSSPFLSFLLPSDLTVSGQVSNREDERATEGGGRKSRANLFNSGRRFHSPLFLFLSVCGWKWEEKIHLRIRGQGTGKGGSICSRFR